MANDNTLKVEVTADVGGLNSGLNQAEKGVKTFGSATTKMAAQTNKMGSAVKANAVPALTSFSQVIQDAPYGIRGVANNIQQLTSQFGYLSAKTGGVKGALKGMIGALAGPAGILFAVSAVTSLMVSYEKEIKNFIFGTDDAKISIDKLNDALREQINLRKLLKDELSVATNIAVAEAKLAGKSLEEQYKVRKEYSEANIKILETQYAEAKKTVKDFYEKTKAQQGKGDEDLINQQKAYSKDANDVLKALNDAKAKLYLDDLNEQIRIQEAQKKSTSTFRGELVSSLQGFATEIKPISNEIKSDLQGMIPKADLMATEIAIFDQYLDSLKMSLGEFRVAADSIIRDGIIGAFQDLGTGIGDALANGGNVMDAAMGAILDALGSTLVQFGTLVVAAGFASEAFASAMKNPFGGGIAAIIAGTALIAIGGAVKAFSGNLGSGGSNSSSTDYSSGSTSSRSYGSNVSTSSGSSGGTYVFEIAGTKLIGVLKNTLDRNSSLGGTNLVF